MLSRETELQTLFCGVLGVMRDGEVLGMLVLERGMFSSLTFAVDLALGCMRVGWR